MDPGEAALHSELEALTFESRRGIIRGIARAFPGDFDAVTFELGYQHEDEIDGSAKERRDDEQWAASRERWGDHPGQPRRFPDLPLDHPLNDPRKRQSEPKIPADGWAPSGFDTEEAREIRSEETPEQRLRREIEG